MIVITFISTLLACIKLSSCPVFLHALRLAFDRSADGSQHVALSEVSCDAAGYAPSGVVESSLIRSSTTRSIANEERAAPHFARGVVTGWLRQTFRTFAAIGSGSGASRARQLYVTENAPFLCFVRATG
jgi:hypothetical protein